jgi:hypothetical protein
MNRAIALRYVFESNATNSRRSRAMRESLCLNAVVIFMLNALNYREQEDRFMLPVANGCSQHAVIREAEVIHITDSDNEHDDFIHNSEVYGVVQTRGTYWLSDIVLDDTVWRVPVSEFLPSDEVLAKCYYENDIENLRDHFGAALNLRLHKERPRNLYRVNNRTYITDDINYAVEANNVERREVGFRLEQEGVRLQPQPRARGRDVEEYNAANGGGELDDIGNDGVLGINEKLEDIWRQFPVDLLLNGPNTKSKSEPSHILMTEDERRRSTIDDFKTLDLRNKFHVAFVKHVGPDEWNNALFKRFFPGKDKIHYKGDSQNYALCRYYTKWMNLIAKLTSSDVARVHKALQDEFKTLLWLPYAQSDRIWKTNKRALTLGLTPYGPPGYTKPRVYLAVNIYATTTQDILRFSPTPTRVTPTRVAAAIAYEEEEGEEEE